MPGGKQTESIHILTNISGSKDNQTMKFSQLIEYNMRNIFLEKSYTKCGVETILRLWRRFGVFIVNFEYISHLCSSVSIVNFEHVIAGWEGIEENRH